MSTSLKIAAVLIVIALAANIFLFFHNDIKKSDLTQIQNQSTPAIATPSSNVTVADGKQIIMITAKGGYSPKVTTAKADMPTIIKVLTNGTFDCASALSIPDLNYQKNLPASGETLIDVPAQTKGSTLNGSCSMGMYNFSIKFE